MEPIENIKYFMCPVRRNRFCHNPIHRPCMAWRIFEVKEAGAMKIYGYCGLAPEPKKETGYYGAFEMTEDHIYHETQIS